MRPVTLNEAIVEYTLKKISDLQAASTRKAHAAALERYRVWVTAQTQMNVRISDIDTLLQARYFNTLRPPAKRESTFNNYRQYNCAFWNFCIAEGWVRLSPMRYITALIVPERAKLWLSAGELETVVEMAKSPRDRIAVAVGMNTAFRNQDIASLNVGDVNLRSNTISVYVKKTRKRMEFPVTAELREELLRWFPAYAEALFLDDWRLIPNTYKLVPVFAGRAKKGGGSVTVVKPGKAYRHPERIVQDILVKMGFPLHDDDSEYDGKSNNLGFHVLRRSMARMVLDQAGADGEDNPIRVAQATLGHKSQETTEIYLGIDMDNQVRDRMLTGKSLLRRAAEREQATNDAIDAGKFNGKNDELGERRNYA